MSCRIASERLQILASERQSSISSTSEGLNISAILTVFFSSSATRRTLDHSHRGPKCIDLVKLVNYTNLVKFKSGSRRVGGTTGTVSKGVAPQTRRAYRAAPVTASVCLQGVAPCNPSETARPSIPFMRDSLSHPGARLRHESR